MPHETPRTQPLLLNPSGVSRLTLELLLETTLIELMQALDVLDADHGVAIASDPRFDNANRVLGIYVLLRAGNFDIENFLPGLRTHTDEMRRLLLSTEERREVSTVGA